MKNTSPSNRALKYGALGLALGAVIVALSPLTPLILLVPGLLSAGGAALGYSEDKESGKRKRNSPFPDGFVDDVAAGSTLRRVKHLAGNFMAAAKLQGNLQRKAPARQPAPLTS